MDEVAETGREIVITKRGKPVARLVPIPAKTGCASFGLYRRIKIRIHGDIEMGAALSVEWEQAESEADPYRVLNP